MEMSTQYNSTVAQEVHYSMYILRESTSYGMKICEPQTLIKVHISIGVNFYHQTSFKDTVVQHENVMLKLCKV